MRKALIIFIFLLMPSISLACTLPQPKFSENVILNISKTPRISEISLKREGKDKYIVLNSSIKPLIIYDNLGEELWKIERVSEPPASIWSKVYIKRQFDENLSLRAPCSGRLLEIKSDNWQDARKLNYYTPGLYLSLSEIERLNIEKNKSSNQYLISIENFKILGRYSDDDFVIKGNILIIPSKISIFITIAILFILIIIPIAIMIIVRKLRKSKM